MSFVKTKIRLYDIIEVWADAEVVELDCSCGGH